MGARQSKRSVDITTTPKKGEGEVAAVGEEKIEKLGDADVKAVVTNGTATHTDIEFADKDEETKEPEEKPSADIKENGLPESSDGEKTPDKEAAAPAAGDQPVKTEETPVEKTAENGEKTAETPDSKKQKEKKKKKWSLRSISFSKKDKSKPSKDKDKNGEVEEVNEEKAEEAVTNPTSEPVKSDESKASTDNATTPVTNGDASKEELSVKVPEEVAEVEKKEVEKPEEAAAASKAEPKSEPEAPVKAEEAPKPVTEEPKPVVEETSASAVEAVKEVRSEEVPPPLPSSNPPSQVMVFAESTKANILLSEDIPVCEKPEVPVGESVNPPETQEPSNISPPIVESVASIESTPVLPVEEEQTCAETHAPTSPTSSVENKPPSPVTSSVEVLPEVQDIPILDASESEQKSILEQNDSVVSATVSSTESSPLIIEALPKKSDESLQVSETSDFTLGKDEPSSNSLAQSELDTSNSPLIESQENCQIESEQASLKTENEDSMVSVPSVPVMIEEKVPVVSSAGDVPSQLESHISLQSDDSSLQELKSNLNLKDSPTSQEPSIASQEQSTDLSTIPEVESRDSKLEETADTLTEPISLAANVNEIADSPSKTLGSEQIGHEEVELSPSLAHKDIEPTCNAGSLPDLSTESLPSLPEPSDSVLEPMSLPPLDSVPDPIVDDIPVSPSKIESPTPKPLETEPPVVLTNGNATNGLKSSPTADDDESPLPLPLDGPLKQIVAPEPLVGDVHENSQSTGEAPAESNESAPATDE